MTSLIVREPQVVVNTSDLLQGVERATPDEVIEFVNTASTAMGRSTFYNLAEEQRAALLAKHLPVLQRSRPLYALMALPPGTTDVNKQAIIYNLLRTSADLETIQYSGPTQKLWENAVILDAMHSMKANHVLNLGFQFVKSVATSKDGGVAVRPGIHNRRTKRLMTQFLQNNRSKLSLWFIKYQRQMRVWVRHLHLASDFHPGVGFLFDDYNGGDALIDNYLCVQRAKAKPWDSVEAPTARAFKALPYTVAEGFAKKFGLDRDTFLAMFASTEGTMTKRERVRQKSEGERHGVDTGVNLEGLDLWDLLVFLNQETRIKRQERTDARDLLRNAARRTARKLGANFEKAAVVLDTSLSMIGTEEGRYHPLLRAMAVRYVLEAVTNNFQEYRTVESNTLFPILHSQSNYAAAVLKALKDGYRTIFIVGDGYENAPFEGATHQVLWTFKNKLDPENKATFIHLNPVFASEAKDVRQVSDLAPAAGVLDHKNLGTAIYLATSKSNPLAALKTYVVDWLVNLQSLSTKELMSAAGISQQRLLSF